MADSTTTNLGLTKPEVGASTDSWGTKINTDLDSIDALFDAGPVLKVTKGGTGAATASAARTNLGATTLGGNLFTVTNPSAVTFPRFNEDNSVSSLNASDFRAAIGAGTGTGDVTLTGTQTLTNKTIAFANNTLTGVAPTASPEFSGAIYDNGSVRGNIVAVAALSIDCSLGNYFTKTISTNSTFTFSNAPASRSYAFTLELTQTSGNVTWPASVKWPSDTAPTLTTGKTQIFVFLTDDGGTRWRGAALVDYVN
jgi:hypothetical protein